MSRSPSNVSVVSDQRYIPWQYKWKRPRVAEAKTCCEVNSPRLVNDLANKVPISTLSSRLNENELRSLLPQTNRVSEDCRDKHGTKGELSEIAYEESQDGHQMIPSDDSSYFVMVTTFASKPIATFLQSMSKEKDKIVVPADTILMEVIRDSHCIHNTKGTEYQTNFEEMDVVMSKLLYWPTSIHSYSIDGETMVDESNTQSVQDDWNFWKRLLRSLRLEKPTSRMTPEEKERYYALQNELRLTRIKRRVGVTSISICRQVRDESEQVVDMDEVVGVLDRLSLGIQLGADPDMPSRNASKIQIPFHANDNSGTLLLSCLCSDGRVQVFSLMDLLLGHDANSNVDAMHDGFHDGFESLLFGNSVKATLDQNILPLSSPVATINLSVVDFQGREVINREISDIHQVSNNPMNNTVGEVMMKIGQQIDDFRPHFDISSFNANIEISTLRNQTVNNIPFLCTSAFGYIIVGGMGDLKYQSAEKMMKTEPKVKSHFNRLRGGFVSFISAKYLTETRTVYLPFCPKEISPVVWKSVEMVIVVGYGVDQCVAIRMDSSSYLFPLSQTEQESPSPCAAIMHQFEPLKKFCPVNISFDLPTEIGSAISFPVGVSRFSDSVPSIILCSIDRGDINLQRFDLNELQIDKKASVSNQKRYSSLNCSISAHHIRRRFVNIPPMSVIEEPSVTMLNSGVHIDQENIDCINGVGWVLIGINIGAKSHIFYANFDGSDESEGAYYQEIAVLDNPEYNCRRKIMNIDFLTRIPGLHTDHSNSLTSFVPYEAPTSNSALFSDSQAAVCSFRLDSDKTIVVTMRRNAVADGPSSSFHEIISWLCSEYNYFTAAKIALTLLKDDEALLDLEHAALNSAEFPYEDASYRDAILEGISLFSPKRTSNSDLSTSSKSQQDMWMSDVSNKAVICLVNGGSELSHALDNFLARNKYYDASSASQVLVSTTKEIVKKLNSVEINLAPYSFNPMALDGHALWPIQCLLRVATARSYMEPALEMLNESIPDLLRHRFYQELNRNDCNLELSLQLSKSIISMILASAENAGSILMNLVDHVTKESFWDSLDEGTRFSLSILHVRGRYPLLREFEVRTWALGLLQKATRLAKCDNPVELDDLVKSDWLREICTGVLCNAGCDLSNTILFTPALSATGIQEFNTADNDIFRQIQEEEDDLYDYLQPVPGCGGIDYDLIIPAFLILEKRKVHWLGNEKVPSQTVLNILCDLAGRHFIEEPIYPFDDVSAMKQCVLLENPEAAANLIGGHNGLYLKCAYILSKECDLSIQEAEEKLVGCSTSIPCRNNTVEDETEFILTNGHKSLLWLMEKYVMRIKKYGEFYSEDSRGSINPVYAARVCLKTWLILVRIYPSSGRWLEIWLRGRLNLQEKDLKTNRLPCSALAHALLWNEEQTNEQNPSLAVLLNFSAHFLTSLAQIPCGIKECTNSDNFILLTS